MTRRMVVDRDRDGLTHCCLAVVCQLFGSCHRSTLSGDQTPSLLDLVARPGWSYLRFSGSRDVARSGEGHALALRGHCVTVATAQRRKRRMSPSLLALLARTCRNYLRFLRPRKCSVVRPRWPWRLWRRLGQLALEAGGVHRL
jgi:hypothetical protein